MNLNDKALGQIAEALSLLGAAFQSMRGDAVPAEAPAPTPAANVPQDAVPSEVPDSTMTRHTRDGEVVHPIPAVLQAITPEVLEAADGKQLSEWLLLTDIRPVPRKVSARVEALRNLLGLEPLGEQALTPAPTLPDPIKEAITEVVEPNVNDLFGDPEPTGPVMPSMDMDRDAYIAVLQGMVSEGTLPRTDAMAAVQQYDRAHA